MIRLGPFDWWLRKAVKRRLAPRIGRETIRLLILHDDLKPVVGKTMWNVLELDEDYITKTADVLETYEQPYNPNEKAVTLHADVRAASPARPGRERIGTDATARAGNTEPCRDGYPAASS